MGDRAEGPSPKRRRVLVEDSRGNGTYLRTTWHPEGRTFVFSVWHEDVCTAAVRLPVERSPEVISLLVDGLADAAAGGAGPAAGEQPARPPVPSAPTGTLANARTQLQTWARWAAQRARDIVGKPPTSPPPPPPDLPDAVAEPPTLRTNGHDRRTA
jgi:hypothetical protein